MVTTFGGSGTSHAVASKSKSGSRTVGPLKPFWRCGAERLGKSDRFAAVLGKKEAFKFGFASLLTRRWRGVFKEFCGTSTQAD
jgi:hypothetical protein